MHTYRGVKLVSASADARFVRPLRHLPLGESLDDDERAAASHSRCQGARVVVRVKRTARGRKVTARARKVPGTAGRRNNCRPFLNTRMRNPSPHARHERVVALTSDRIQIDIGCSWADTGFYLSNEGNRATPLRVLVSFSLAFRRLTDRFDAGRGFGDTGLS
jgi:hypothetical protein